MARGLVGGGDMVRGGERGLLLNKATSEPQPAPRLADMSCVNCNHPLVGISLLGYPNLV